MPAGSPVSGTRVWSDPNSGGTTDFLVRPELRRQFRAFFILTELKNHHTKENRHEKHGKNHGQDRGPVQKSGLRLCRLRNLRGPGQHLGLRPSGCGAEKQCEEQGGHLVTITSEGEQNFINSLIDSDSCVWIGGKRNTKNVWVWVTGEEWKYENWAPGEPNNSSNMISNENRVVIWNNSGQWNDLNDKNIEEQNGFVCEWE